MMNCFGLSNSAIAWLDKYYPISVERVTSKWPWIKAAKYSLLKWKGARPKILEKHGLEKRGVDIYDRNSDALVICFDCVICHMCIRSVIDPFEDKYSFRCCYHCPFTKIFHNNCYNSINSPYALWEKYNDPEPMIKALEKVYRVLKRDPKFMSKRTPL